MAIYFLSTISVFIAAIIAQSSSHVIGGGLNTDFDLHAETPAWLQSSIRDASSAGTVKRSIGFRPVQGSGSEASPNPFLRARRSNDCPVPANLPELVKDLNPYLNASQFLGLLVNQEDGYSPLPQNQPATGDCPSENGSWWPRSEDNLRSTCPWIIKETDLETVLGADIYPRKIQEADCLCKHCISANAMDCTKMRQQVTVFRRGGCRDGLAVMTKVNINITVGCYCASSTNAQRALPTPTQ